MQQKGEVIIMGDLNAKVEINSQKCKQTESRNGNILQEYIKQTNTIILNTTENNQGTWTRVNRKNNCERSVIDYIITSRPLQNRIIDSATDTDNMYKIAGINPTDHNVITATISTEITTTCTTTRIWRRGTIEEWKNFNQELQSEWHHTRVEDRNYTSVQNHITSCLQSTIGSNIIKRKKKEKRTNPIHGQPVRSKNAHKKTNKRKQ